MRVRIWGWAVAATLALAVSASASTFTVDTTVDAVDVVPGDGTCATSTGACSLRAAVMEGNARGPATTVVNLPAGTFVLALAGAGEDAAAIGDLDLTRDTVIAGAGRTLTVVDAAGLDRVVDVVGAAVTLRDLTLRGGDAGTGDGGGLHGSATLTRVDISSCRAAGGGAVAGNVVTATDCVFADDVATSGDGGGVAAPAGLVATDCVFTRNEATTGHGGGLSTGPDTTLIGCTFDANVADALGGGISIDVEYIPIRTLTRCHFVGNTARAGGGIAVTRGCSTGGSQVDAIECVIERNTAGWLGGGVAAIAGSCGRESVGFRAIGCTISSNTARRGSAAATLCAPMDWAGIILVNTTVSGNHALDGGTIDVSPDCTARLDGATVTANVADVSGGGVSNDRGVLHAAGSIIAGNVGGPDGRDCSGNLYSEGFDILGDATGCTLLGDVAGVRVGVDPLLGPLADNGGPTMTHLPAPGSLAIDRGSPAACAGCVDQRGLARIADGDGDGAARRDIGAVEAGSGPDADGDGVSDADETACGPFPAQPEIRVARDSAGLAVLTWADTTTPPSSSPTAYDIALDALAGLLAARAATAPCVATGLAALTWVESSPPSCSSCYHLVRASNGCGSASGAWGLDSLGVSRPACP